MDNTFWDDMVEIWCRVTDQKQKKEIAGTAKQHGIEDLKKKTSYSLNPLDDEDEDDEDDF